MQRCLGRNGVASGRTLVRGNSHNKGWRDFMGRQGVGVGVWGPCELQAGKCQGRMARVAEILRQRAVLGVRHGERSQVRRESSLRLLPSPGIVEWRSSGPSALCESCRVPGLWPAPVGHARESRKPCRRAQAACSLSAHMAVSLVHA